MTNVPQNYHASLSVLRTFADTINSGMTNNTEFIPSSASGLEPDSSESRSHTSGESSSTQFSGAGEYCSTRNGKSTLIPRVLLEGELKGDGS